MSREVATTANSGYWRVGGTWVGGVAPDLDLVDAQILDTHMVTIDEELIIPPVAAVMVRDGGTLSTNCFPAVRLRGALLVEAFGAVQNNGGIIVEGGLLSLPINAYFANAGGSLICNAAGTPPAAPTLAVAQLTATSLRAAIDGDDGATNHLFLAAGSGAAWTAAGDCAGDGDIDVIDLTTGQVYLLVAASSLGGVYGPPSAVQALMLTVADDGTPAGSLSIPLALLRTSLASCPRFRAWIGATGAEEEQQASALARIYVGAAETWARPYILVGEIADYQAVVSASGVSNVFDHRGGLRASFEADAGGGEPGAELLAFANAVGEILDELKERAGLGGYLNVIGVGLDEGPVRCARDETDGAAEREDYWQATARIEWR